MEVKGLTNDPVSNTPIVILGRADGEAFLPIWIGLCEANAIALELESITTPRPMTHDLLAAVLRGARHTLERVTINALEDNVFRADLQFRGPGGASWSLDARPSDAIALALRTRAGIFATPDVLKKAQLRAAVDEDHAIRLVLECLRPEDLGKYKM
ncbi:MAG: bifunctional nuclease family protein [Acidobacteria bacterium]|nr:bifunctional nuclease family protein [Acidobacteriota bacterium]